MQEPANDTSPTRVLIVDDSPVDRMLYRRMLTHDHGPYTVQECGTAEDALTCIHEQRPDCMLLDYQLPGMSGITLMRKLQDGYGEAPVPTIMLTGLSEDALALRAMQAGIDLLLAKGYVTRDSLRGAIRTVIEGYMPRRMRILEAEFRYASVAYAAKDVLPTPTQLTEFAIVSELQRLCSALRHRTSTEYPNSLRMLGA